MLPLTGSVPDLSIAVYCAAFSTQNSLLALFHNPSRKTVILLPRPDAWLDRTNAHFKESQQNLSKESQLRTLNILVYSIDLIRPSRQLGDTTTVYFLELDSKSGQAGHFILNE